MKIGFTSTTFRQIKDLGRIAEIAKKANADYIEWGGDIHVKSVEDALKAKKVCEENGIGISSYGSYYVVGSRERGEWQRICETAAAMGAKYIRVWLGKKGSAKTSDAEYRALVEDCADMCCVAAQHGLTVSAECHEKTYNDNTDCALKFISDLGKDNFKTYFQSHYRNREYDTDRMKRTLPHTDIIHISYSEAVRMQVFAKKDKAYVDDIIKFYKGLGFDGLILVEYTFFASPEKLIADVQKILALWGDRG